MEFSASRLPYRQTNAFSRVCLDYIDQLPAIKPFYQHSPDISGVKAAIKARQGFPTNRKALQEALQMQYANVETSQVTKDNIASLLQETTFTITTAHQNNIFTGPLYFIYKIVHAIRLADHLKTTLPGFHFVPVYYIGSEDADLDELNHIWLSGEKLVWPTQQTGAVGAMKVDKGLLQLLDTISGQVSVLPHGEEIISIFRKYYTTGTTIARATFSVVNELFADYGLVVVIPEPVMLKQQMIPVFREELLQQTSSPLVEETAVALDKAGYKVQANPREINLFYLGEGFRERIEQDKDGYKVIHTNIRFTKEEMLKELELHPEKFSPNVILRGVYQSTILPDVCFIGGGGETAYWVQLKSLFTHYNIPFPVLVLRNSFLLVEKKWLARISKLGFFTEDFFLPAEELMRRLVARDSSNPTQLNGSLHELENLYESFKKQAAAVDGTLEKHVEALKSKTVQRLLELEKKMLRAEKRKFNDEQRQILTVKQHLFPGNGLQERVENIAWYYGLWGKELIAQLYKHSPALEQEFTILSGS